MHGRSLRTDFSGWLICCCSAGVSHRSSLTQHGLSQCRTASLRHSPALLLWFPHCLAGDPQVLDLAGLPRLPALRLGVPDDQSLPRHTGATHACSVMLLEVLAEFGWQTAEAAV